MEKRLYICVSPQTVEHNEATANYSLRVQPCSHEQADLSLQNFHAQVDSRPNDTQQEGGQHLQTTVTLRHIILLRLGARQPLHWTRGTLEEQSAF